MQPLAFVVIATAFGCLMTALGYILIKRSHAAGVKKNCHNFMTWEFVTGFFICSISIVINIGNTSPI